MQIIEGGVGVATKFSLGVQIYTYGGKILWMNH